MTDARLKSLAERMMAHAKECFERDGHVMPFFHAVTDGGETILIAVPWDGNEMKDAVAAVLRDLFKEKRVTHYGLITEAWMATSKKEDALPTGSLEHVPGRKEIIMATTENAAHECFSLFTEIVRPDGDKPHLRPMDDSPFAARMEGRFHGLIEHNPNLRLQ